MQSGVEIISDVLLDNKEKVQLFSPTDTVGNTLASFMMTVRESKS
jgi:hypothetical protein